MRKGTFSVQRAGANSSKHNSRETPPKYLIGLEDGTKNYYELIQSDDDFILEAQNIYKEKIKQSMQKKQVENLIQETVLTLQPNQNENDVKELFKKLKSKYGGHEILEVSIHRDEGHFLKNGIAYYPTKNILQKNDGWYICSDSSIDKPKGNDFDKKVDISTFKKVYNYHAHVKFSMFDKELGKSARMQKKDMSERIKFVSDELGLIFAPGENSRVKKSVNQIKDEHLASSRAKEKIHQKANEYIKNKTVPLAKVKDLNAEIDQLRKELIATKSATKEDYNKLKEEKESLKAEIKNKTLTVDQLQQEIKELKTNLISKDKVITKQNEAVNSSQMLLKVKEKKINELKTQINSLEAQKEVLPSKDINLNEKNDSRPIMKQIEAYNQIEEVLNKQIEKKEVKTGLMKSEEVEIIPDKPKLLTKIKSIVKDSYDYLAKHYTALQEKYNALATKYNNLLKENKDIKIENLELKHKVKELQLNTTLSHTGKDKAPGTEKKSNAMDLIKEMQSKAISKDDITKMSQELREEAKQYEQKNKGQELSR